jgi:hypothetical protein
MVAMQRFIAELSKLVDKSEFERSWQSDTARKPDFKVEFDFSGRRVYITVHSDLPGSGHLMNFIGFSPRLFAESIEAAMSDGFEDGSQWRRSA